MEATKNGKYQTVWERRDIVAKWRASGLSQAEFCRQEGLQQWQLSMWKRGVGKPSQTKSEPDSSSTKRGEASNRRSRSATERHWKQVIADHAASGLSALKFCSKYGISINSFKRWRGIFSTEAEPKKSAGTASMANPFVEVSLPTQGADTSGMIRSKLFFRAAA